MKKNRILAVFAMLAVSLLADATMAGLVVPNGLSPGDEYHLVFVTQGTTQAKSSNIADYNSFVMAQAALNPGDTGTNMGVTWSAIGSTATVDARDNALVEAPVYLLNSSLVATGFADMWNGSLSVNINIDQFGVTKGGFPSSGVWTGSLDSGVGGSNASGQLGQTVVTQGNFLVPNSNWISASSASNFNSSFMYALSSKLTVAAVPEPGSVLFCLTMALVGGCYHWFRVD